MPRHRYEAVPNTNRTQTEQLRETVSNVRQTFGNDSRDENRLNRACETYSDVDSSVVRSAQRTEEKIFERTTVAMPPPDETDDGGADDFEDV